MAWNRRPATPPHLYPRRDPRPPHLHLDVRRIEGPLRDPQPPGLPSPCRTALERATSTRAQRSDGWLRAGPQGLVHGGLAQVPASFAAPPLETPAGDRGEAPHHTATRRESKATDAPASSTSTASTSSPSAAPTSSKVGVLIEEPFPMLALDAQCKQLHDSMRDMMSMQDSVHRQLVAKTKGRGRGRLPHNGWLSSKVEEVKGRLSWLRIIQERHLGAAGLLVRSIMPSLFRPTSRVDAVQRTTTFQVHSVLIDTSYRSICCG